MSFQLTIEPIGQTLAVGEDQSILDACLRAGIWLPHACCHGLCATCKVRVREGEVDHGEASPFALMDFEREEGQTLACCARLQSDVVIEADIDDDPDAQVLPVQDFNGTVVRVAKAYPAYFGAYREIDALRRHLDSIENLFAVGRNGMHRYNNQDHSMLSAKKAVEAILAGSADKSAIWAVNIDDDYHEEKA